ncbi:MAG: site-2 protease family protein [Peptostreptococcaceae bacterium]
MNFLSEMLVRLVAIAIALSVHEFGHALAAYLLGDNTAKMQGRLTLDPAKHIDPIGLIALMIVRVGWAKPVPVNPNNFKSYKWGNVIVSLAGALGNIIMAIISFKIAQSSRIDAVYLIASTSAFFNMSFAAFNLLPIPPLDGWGVVSAFIPLKWNEFVYKYESYGQLILLIAIFTNTYSIIFAPIYNVIANIVRMFL